MSKAPLGQMIVELGLDSTDFGKGLNSAKREVRTWSNEMSASMRAADLAGNKVGKLQARYDGLTKVISAQQKQVDSLKQSYDNSFVDGKPTAQTEKLASQLKKAEANLITYQSELRTTAGELAKMRVQTEGFTGWLNNTGKQLQTAGKHMTNFGDAWTKRVSLPLAAGVTLATKAASDWESSFAGVMKTNDEVVDSNGNVIYSYQDLEDGLRDMTSELPATHAEITEVAEAAGQLGIEAENVTSFTRTMIDMGESTNLSAESAASSLARLANITNMSQDDFDRLGSAIVGLGNNFATTEAEITDMALRLAGTGNQIGMTEADILALATAMSSVGIRAEAGGTAMSTVLKKIQNAVADNSDELKLFANVADVSAKEFAKAFEDDPARALQLFVEGLERSSDEGENLNAVLGDLGIKGIREADTLLRLAGNSSLLGDALDLSATSWEENTALAEEAGLRYETLESQLGMLRNEAVDMAIDFGGPLVKAFREALEAARPLLNNISDLAEAFANADEETQQSIIRMVGFGIAAGPVIGTVGRLATGIGGATVKTVDFLAEMAKKKAMTDFGTAAMTASGAKGIGGMTLALSSLNPWLIGLVGAGGLLSVGYGAWKLWGEEAWEAGQRTREWGTDVGEVTDEALTEIKGYSSEAIGEFGLIATGLSDDTEGMVENFQKMGQSIEQDMIAQIDHLRESVEMLPEEIQEAANKILDETEKKQQESLEIIKENNKRAEEIRETASKREEGMTTLEGKRIRALMVQNAEEYLKVTIKDANDRKEVLEALTGDISNLTEEQARERVITLGKQRRKMKKEQSKELQDYKDHLEERGVLNTQEGEALVQLYEDWQNQSGKALDNQIAMFAEKYPQLAEEILFSNGQLISEMDEGYEAMLASNQRLIENAESFSIRLGVAIEQSAKNLSWLGDEATYAGRTWNDIVFDEKTGEIKTNVREEVIAASESSVTWNHIRFQLKEANLDSNAKLIIGEAAITNGYWEGMSWEEKQLVLENNFSENVYKALEETGLWNNLETEEKIALLKNGYSDTVIQGLIDIGKWNDMPVEQQEAILTSNTPETLIQVLKDIGVWDEIDPKIHRLLVNRTEAQREINAAERELDEYGNIKVPAPSLTAENKTHEGVNSAQRTINSLQGKKVRLITEHVTFGKPGGAGLARGTNFHKGGPAIVNDQKGPLFRELVQYPTGGTFIPYGRNVYIPDMPRGAKVLRASLTKQRFPDIPQYATGVGNIPVDSTVVQNIRNTRSTINNQAEQSHNMQIIILLQDMLKYLTDGNIKNMEVIQNLTVQGSDTPREHQRELVRRIRDLAKGMR